MPSHPGRKAAPIYLEMVSECASHFDALLAEGRLSWAFDSADLLLLARAARLRSLEDLLDDIGACDLGGGRPDIDETARQAAARLCDALTLTNKHGTCVLAWMVNDASRVNNETNSQFPLGRLRDAVVLAWILDTDAALHKLFDARSLSHHERLEILSGDVP